MVQGPRKKLDLQFTNSHTFLNITTQICTKINSYLMAPYIQGSLNSSFHTNYIYLGGLTGHFTDVTFNFESLGQL